MVGIVRSDSDLFILSDSKLSLVFCLDWSVIVSL